MATRDRLLRLEKVLALGDEKRKTCIVAYDWPNDDGTFEHIEIHMTPQKFHRYCENLEKIYGDPAKPANAPEA